MPTLGYFQRLNDLSVQCICEVNVVLRGVGHRGQKLVVRIVQSAEKAVNNSVGSRDDQVDGKPLSNRVLVPRLGGFIADD